LRAGYAAAFAVDGPHGPARAVRKAGKERTGAVMAAKLGHGAVAPMAAACASPWVLRSSWDRFEIPKPFSRVAVVVGPILVCREATAEELAGALDGAVERANALLSTGPIHERAAPISARRPRT